MTLTKYPEASKVQPERSTQFFRIRTRQIAAYRPAMRSSKNDAFTRSRGTILPHSSSGSCAGTWRSSHPPAPAAASPQPPSGVPAGLTKCTQALPAWCGQIEVPLDRTGRTRRHDDDPLPVLPGHRHHAAR